MTTCHSELCSLIFDRFNARLVDALDSDHGDPQAPHRKASAASYRHLRSLQLAFHVQKRSQEEAENEIKAAFDAHECKVMDSSQNTQRIVRG